MEGPAGDAAPEKTTSASGGQPNAGQPADPELVRRAQAGDVSAFSELVKRHQKQLYRLALRMMGTEQDAEEVLQEALLNAFEKLGEFRAESAFNSWVYRITANTALMRLRRRRRAPDNVMAAEPAVEETGPKFSSEGAYVDPPRSDWSLRADDALHNQQLGEAIREAVANLSEDYRVVFLMKDVDGLSNEQIANALGLTVPAVKSRLHRARLALREQLGEFFQPR